MSTQVMIGLSFSHCIKGSNPLYAKINIWQYGGKTRTDDEDLHAQEMRNILRLRQVCYYKHNVMFLIFH